MFCHSFLYIDNYRFIKQLLSSFIRSVVIVTLVHPDIEKQAWYSSHIWSPAGSGQKGFLNRSTKVIHNSFLSIYKNGKC